MFTLYFHFFKLLPGDKQSDLYGLWVRVKKHPPACNLSIPQAEADRCDTLVPDTAIAFRLDYCRLYTYSLLHVRKRNGHFGRPTIIQLIRAI